MNYPIALDLHISIRTKDKQVNKIQERFNIARYYKRIWIMIDAFLMMYQTNCMDCVAQSEQKTVWKWKIGVRKKPCAVVLSIWEKQVKSP